MRRHSINISRPDPLSPLSVGNGEFAFTADVTGLQTFPEFHQDGIPLCTQSQGGWHSMPNPHNYRLEDTFSCHRTFDGKQVPYPYPYPAGADESFKNSPEVKWLKQNPHRLNLGRVGLALGDVAAICDLTNINQHLDLWRGILSSAFCINAVPVQVETCVHPELDILAVRVSSALLTDGQCGIALNFGYPEPGIMCGDDYSKPELHTTAMRRIDSRNYLLTRDIDSCRYCVRIKSSMPLAFEQAGAHQFIFRSGRDSMDMVIAFSREESLSSLPDFNATAEACLRHWEQFWTTGGAIDLSDSDDSRAGELERRIVLSQYLTAIQCAGSMPPQESGLTHNSWFGKFHLEMHWWHAAHFALWNRGPLLEKCLPWYQSILPAARKYAEFQGYRGARWPKMIGPDGRDCPSDLGSFLIWQQPHLIFFSELLRRAYKNTSVLEKYQELVFETAEFMASFPAWDNKHSRFVLGPPVCPAQEAGVLSRQYPVNTIINPVFELACWKTGLDLAQNWRLQLGLSRNKQWDEILQHLSLPAVIENVYPAAENIHDSFSNPALLQDHPSTLAAYGMLPGANIDRETMRRTLHLVLEKWQWQGWTWGWDYPMTAMCAARLGEPETAIDALLMDTPANRWLKNGHCFQAKTLPAYLPANGGLLYAVAMMAAGWDGAPDTDTPGFPKNGWRVRHEDLNTAL